ncbi:MAG: late competence development ComFB family protein [Oscillospiraceae bacterium]
MKLYQNIMEQVVEKELDALLPSLDVCNCDRCKNDIVAYALNQLPAKYIVSDKGYLYAKIQTAYLQYEVDVMQAITRAAKVVRDNPRHNENVSQHHMTNK